MLLRGACSRRRTAALLNSLSASAAIHLAAGESIRPISLATAAARRFSRLFRLPMLRSAQFTAFFTKFRSSVDARLTSLRKGSNCASAAALSCTAYVTSPAFDRDR